MKQSMSVEHVVRFAHLCATAAVRHASANAPYSIAPVQKGREIEDLITTLTQEKACQQSHLNGWIRGFAASRLLNAAPTDDRRKPDEPIDEDSDEEPPRNGPERKRSDEDPDR